MDLHEQAEVPVAGSRRRMNHGLPAGLHGEILSNERVSVSGPHGANYEGSEHAQAEVPTGSARSKVLAVVSPSSGDA